MDEVLVTRKGQITVPIALRRKYGIKVVPRFEDLIGTDAGKIDPGKVVEMLDKMRSKDRY